MNKYSKYLISGSIILFLVLSMAVPSMGQTDYDIDYIDSQGDVKEYGDYEPLNVSGFEDIDIISASSTKAMIKQDVIFQLQVVGKITIADNIVYGVYILDGESEIYMALYTNGTCMGYRLDTMDVTGEILIASIDNSDTLQVTVPIKNFGLLSDFDFYTFSSEYIEEDEFLPLEYIDYAPDQDTDDDIWDDWDSYFEKVIYIEEPYNGSTQHQVCTIMGTTEDPETPIEYVEIQIDSNIASDWNKANSIDNWATWDYQWDTREVSDGKYIVRSRAFNGEGYFYDNITIFVDQTSAIDPETCTALELSVGDYFEYSIINYFDTDEFLQGAEFSGKMKIFVKEKTKVSVKGNEYEVFVVDIDGDIEISMDVFRTKTIMDGYSWFRVSDLAVIKEETEIVSQITGFGMDEKTTYKELNIYSPPVNKFKFPLSVCDTWQTQTMKSIEITSDEPGNNDVSDNFEESIEYDFACLRTETIVVPFGTFETFLVYVSEYYEEDDTFEEDNSHSGATNENPGEGGNGEEETIEESSSGYTIEYFSPELGYVVKTESYDDNRQLLMSYELVSYEHGKGSSNPQPSSGGIDFGPGIQIPIELCLILLIIIFVIIISIIVIIRRRNKMVEEILISEYNSAQKQKTYLHSTQQRSNPAKQKQIQEQLQSQSEIATTARIQSARTIKPEKK